MVNKAVKKKQKKQDFEMIFSKPLVYQPCLSKHG